MPYARGETISKGYLEAGIVIDEVEYAAARGAKRAGRQAVVIDGVLVIRDPAPGPDYQWQNGAWTLPAAVAAQPTVDDVDTEKERRLGLGFDYDFADARGVHRIGTTPKDMKGWDEVTKFADALRTAGATTTTISILTNTGPASVTPDEWNRIMLAAAACRQPIWQASFVLAATDPIPADYADDSHWPS